MAEKPPLPWLRQGAYDSMPLAERSLMWARSQVGVRERGGPNRGPEVEGYLAAAGLGGGHAWCAAFVLWCVTRAGADRARLPRSAAAVRSWFSVALRVDAVRQVPRRGDLFFWLDEDGRGHIGFVAEVDLDGRRIRTIEGNTDAARGSRDGDGVYERWRSLRSFTEYRHWGFIDLAAVAE